MTIDSAWARATHSRAAEHRRQQTRLRQKTWRKWANEKCDDFLNACAERYLEHCPDRMPSLEGLCKRVFIAVSTAKDWRDNPGTVEEVRFAEIARALEVAQCVAALNVPPRPRKGRNKDPNERVALRVLSKHGYKDQVEATVDVGARLAQMAREAVESARQTQAQGQLDPGAVPVLPPVQLPIVDGVLVEAQRAKERDE